MTLLDLFKNKKCFKLVCGAGNENTEEIEKLVMLYSLAGCNFFDLCAKTEVLIAAKKGLRRAGIKEDRYLCVSVGSESDQHFCKAEIETSKCINCNTCIDLCPQDAINEKHEVIKTKCIGCKKCIEACPSSCISLVKGYGENREMSSIIQSGLDCIEFHVEGTEKDLFERWQELNKLFNGVFSISINRSAVGDNEMVEIVRKLLSIRKPYTTIIQADGIPMSGGKDSYQSTLQAVATADIFKNSGLEAYIMASGGTNTKTTELAQQCGVELDGVAIGSFARKIVKEYIERDDFFENQVAINSALKIAKELVDVSLKNL